MEDVRALRLALRRMHRRAQKAEGTIEKARDTLTAALRRRELARTADGQKRLVPADRISRADVAYALRQLGGPREDNT